MLHRAILGSLERFMSLYIEHTAGAFPVWLAPEQAVIVTVSEKQNAYAEEVLSFLRGQGFRVTGDLSADKLGAKIRNARLLRVPYVCVVGDKEAANRHVAGGPDRAPAGMDGNSRLKLAAARRGS